MKQLSTVIDLKIIMLLIFKNFNLKINFYA